MRVRLRQDSVGLTLRLPMPFAREARVELRSAVEATAVHRLRVRCSGSDALPVAPWGHLHATLSARTGPREGERFTVATLSGPGKYVGTMMMMRGRAHDQDPLLFPGPLPLNFLEGDDRITVDGEIFHGTGTEESFNGGWYFSEGCYSRPLSALLHIGEDDDGVHGEVTAVRWNLLSDMNMALITPTLLWSTGPWGSTTASFPPLASGA